MRDVRQFMALLIVMIMAAPAGLFAASHREAPITALDHPADITDFYAFVSYDDPTKITFIMNVDPFLEPSNGPNYFPFDPAVVYRINIDNSYTAGADVSFEFRFTTKFTIPGLFTGYVGALSGVPAPANAPFTLPVNGQSSSPSGTAVIPPAITSLTGPGAAGMNVVQTYTVTMVTSTPNADPTMPANVTRTDMTGGNTLVAVPSNVGPRTMPCYAVDSTTGNFPANGGFSCSGITPLAKQGIYSLGSGIRVFAGTVDDPFYIDLGATFDSFNFRPRAFFAGATSSAGIPIPVLEPLQDLNDAQNYAPDAVSGFNVNTIAIEVPKTMVTKSGKPVIGTWAQTLRPKMTIRPPDPTAAAPGPNDFTQVQRMGNPLINELVIGEGFKDTWSMSAPSADSQFAKFALDPVLARALNAVFGLAVPDPPRADLLPLVQYVGPFATGTPGPVADLLRLNTSVAPTAMASRKRLGFIAGDNAGFPNGRRVSDDVTDIALRAVAGILCTSCTSAGGPFSAANVPLLGDGVNMNDVPYQETFPYVAFAHSGRNRRHVDPGEKACAPNCPE